MTLPVLWKSGKQRCVALSTNKAELRALYNCLDLLLLTLHLFSSLRVSLSVILFSDSLDMVTLLNQPHPKPAEKHLLIEIRKMQAELNGNVQNRVDRLGNITERRLNRDANDCINLIYAVNELVTYMPSVPIILEHCEGKTNPSDCFTKSVDVCHLIDKFMYKW